jgi:hypothetical protein
MPLWNRWKQKPPQGLLIDRLHGLVQGMQGFYACNEASGGMANDSIGTLQLLSHNYGSVNQWIGKDSAGIDTTPGINSLGFWATVPTFLQLPLPLTLAVGLNFDRNSSGGTVPIFSIFSTNSTNVRLVSLEINAATQQIEMGGVNSFTASTMTAGKDYVYSSSFATGNIKTYTNGIQSATNATAFALTWTATSTLSIGYQPGLTARALGSAIYWATWWNRYLSPAEHALIGSSVNSIWQIMQPPQAYWLMDAAAAAFKPYWTAQQPTIGTGIF